MRELLLACPECRLAVAVSFDEAALAQGRSSLDEHLACYRCGNDMVDTERGGPDHEDHGRILIPERVDGSVTRERVRPYAAP